MTSDNIAGHTAAQNTLGEDGLRDGDSLSPATLTNLLQAVQGNGILRFQDGAYGSTRNETNSGNQPGSLVKATSSTLTVSGGFVVLDGALYEFGSGVGNTVTLDLNDVTHGTGGLVLSSNEEAIYTVYVAGSGGSSKVHYEGGAPVDTSTGLYPSASNQYLIDYDTGATQDNMKAVVLAQVRVQYVASGGGSRNVNIVEINDKRVFVEGAADFRVPLSMGTISSGEIADGGSEGVNRVDHLNIVHNENGELTTSDSVNVHWVSHPRYGSFSQTPPGSSDAGYGQGPSRGADRGGGHAADSFYFAGRNNEQTGHYAVRLQGMGVDASSTALTTTGTWTVTADGDSFFMLTPNSGVTITLNPEKDASSNYMFPEGHMIEVCNEGAGTITFDSTGLNSSLASNHRATFIYEGSEWIRCDYQSAIIGISASGSAGAIQLSDGAGGFDHDTDLTWDAAGGELTVNGKLTVTGLIDPTGLELDPQASNPGGVGANTLWLDSGASNRPKIGSNAVMRASDNISELTNDSAFVDAAGAASAAPVASVNTQTGAVVLDADDLADGSAKVMMTAAERTKLSGIETAATADQSAAEVSVAATPTNYTAATADVEAHLSGIDAAIGGVSVTETDPVFTASPAAGITNVGSGQVITNAERTLLGSALQTETDPVFSASPAASITNAGSGLVTTSAERTNWNAAFGWGDHGAAGYLTSAPAPDLLLLDSNGVNMTAGSTSTTPSTKASWNTLTNFFVRTSSGNAPTYNPPLGQITINASGTYQMILSIVFRNATAGWGAVWSSTYTNYTRMWVTRGPTTELGPVQMTYSSSMQNTLVRVLDLQAGDIITPVVYWNMPFSSMECFENSPTTVGFQNYCMIRKVS